MNAAIVILVLAVIGLGVFGACFALNLGWTVLEALVGFIRHEMLMRPKERYYRM